MSCSRREYDIVPNHASIRNKSTGKADSVMYGVVDTLCYMNADWMLFITGMGLGSVCGTCRVGWDETLGWGHKGGTTV